MKLKIGLAMSFVVACTCSAMAYMAAGAVYTESNASSGNAIVVWNRTPDGMLSSASTGPIATGGQGTGMGLGSQGALAIDDANRFLFAVNAGSDSISTFRIKPQGLSLLNVTASGGRHPISLTVRRNVLYVLNDGGAVGATDTIAGFAIDHNGHLTPIVSGLGLSSASVGPAEISFNNDGDLLVVTEKNTNNIDVYTVGSDGIASGPTIFASAAQTPYGFAFGKRNELIISDAMGGAPGAGSVSSYVASQNGMLTTITASAADNQTAPCWIALTADGRFAYTTNTGSGSVSSYAVGFGGALALLNATAGNTGTGSAPVDEAVSNDSRYLYVLAPGTGKVQGFAIAIDGSLTPMPFSPSILASASGLVAR